MPKNLCIGRRVLTASDLQFESMDIVGVSFYIGWLVTTVKDVLKLLIAHLYDSSYSDAQ